MTTKHFESLSADTQDLVDASMQWMDKYWDEGAGLLWSDSGAPYSTKPHTIRSSAWYAIGLLMRQQAGDVARAVRVIDTVLNFQFDAPGCVFHGSFFRAPEEPYPPAQPMMWRDYDPNWREFIITTFALVLLEYADHLPDALVKRIDAAIAKAVDGAIARNLTPSYTNIALMYAFMLCFAGQRLKQSAWIEEGERMARHVYELFKLHATFEEYNSPTYYGTDMYALALWRSYPSISPLLAQLGSEMEMLLWRDIARFYHAGLRNLAGPYDRSYGMDMLRYLALVGVWIRLAIDKTNAPLPDLSGTFDHAHDITFVPLVVLLGAQIPSDVQKELASFSGERQVERIISDSPRRVATAWLGQDRMIGGEFTSHGAPRSTQLHPATIHWRIDANNVGWVRLLYETPVDACASRDRLEIVGAHECIFHVHAPGIRVEQIEKSMWRLPGLVVHVATDATQFDVQAQAAEIEIRYAVEDDQSIMCVLTINNSEDKLD